MWNTGSAGKSEMTMTTHPAVCDGGRMPVWVGGVRRAPEVQRWKQQLMGDDPGWGMPGPPTKGKQKVKNAIKLLHTIVFYFIVITCTSHAKSCLDLYTLIHAYYKNILILIYIVIGSRISDITRNSDKLHTWYIHCITTVLVMSNNMCNFTLIILLLYCVVILQTCFVYL